MKRMTHQVRPDCAPVASDVAVVTSWWCCSEEGDA